MLSGYLSFHLVNEKIKLKSISVITESGTQLLEIPADLEIPKCKTKQSHYNYYLELLDIVENNGY